MTRLFVQGSISATDLFPHSIAYILPRLQTFVKPSEWSRIFFYYYNKPVNMKGGSGRLHLHQGHPRDRLQGANHRRIQPGTDKLHQVKGKDDILCYTCCGNLFRLLSLGRTILNYYVSDS